MAFSFPKSARLKNSRQFQEVEQLGQRRVGTLLVVFILRHKNQSKLGITASRRFGNAVQRNAFKRHMREAFRQCSKEIEPLWIHVKPRSSAHKVSFSALQEELLSLIGQ